jgi:hypothetical protein
LIGRSSLALVLETETVTPDLNARLRGFLPFRLAF